MSEALLTVEGPTGPNGLMHPAKDAKNAVASRDNGLSMSLPRTWNMLMLECSFIVPSRKAPLYGGALFHLQAELHCCAHK